MPSPFFNWDRINENTTDDLARMCAILKLPTSPSFMKKDYIALLEGNKRKRHMEVKIPTFEEYCEKIHTEPAKAPKQRRSSENPRQKPSPEPPKAEEPAEVQKKIIALPKITIPSFLKSSRNVFIIVFSFINLILILMYIPNSTRDFPDV